MNNQKFVVYTVLTGGKEYLRNPFPDNSLGYERICFTDNPELTSKDWTIVLMDNHHLGAERDAKRPKLLPHRFLKDFNLSLYIDNTVEFITDPLDIKKEYENDSSSLVAFKHPWRDCLYHEGEEVIKIGYENELRVREQLDFYRSQGFPEHQGLIAATMMLRKHLDPQLVEVNEEWFEHILRYARRDQISFPYIAWKQKFSYSLFEGELISNKLMKWIPFHDQMERIPAGFSEQIYSWLNPEVETSGMSPREHYLKIGIHKNLVCKESVWELDVLANKYKTDKGSIYYNHHGYAAIYQTYFSHCKEYQINLLEIGLLRHDVQRKNPEGPYDNAPSLKMWREYFPNAFIVGFDIADFSQCPPLKNVKVLRGDMGKTSDLDLILNEVDGQFDIIIDDASHASHHQQIALSYLFKHLREGGLYVIEDLHYQPPHLEHSDLQLTKDVLKNLEKGVVKGTRFISSETLRYIRRNAEFIHFYDSQDRQFGMIFQDNIVFIKKKRENSQSTQFKNSIFGKIAKKIYLSLRKVIA